MNPGFLHDYAFAYQPILGANQSTVAVELLYRQPAASQANVTDDTIATAETIVNALIHTGVDALLGQHKVFINVGEDLLLSDMLLLLPRERVTLELLETIPITRQVIERCHKLKAMGFCLALDDFVCDRIEELSPLLEIADVVKLDMLLNDRNSLPSAIQQLKRRTVKLLAEKVETTEDFEFCKQLGFTLFQGYYFARPIIVNGKKPNPAKVAVLDLLGKLNRDAEDGAIEVAFKHNPGLALQLLRLVNSAAFGMNAKISSLRQVMSILGRRQIIHWLQILLFSLDDSAEYPSPLFELAAKRGKLMEQLAVAPADATVRDHAQMTGMLSLADTLLAMPMPGIIEQLGLAPDLADALLNRTGVLGTMLSLCEKLEVADFDGAEAAAAALGISFSSVMEFQNESISWVNKLSQECHGHSLR